jgi:AbrB family looped-hinge helix DNA binding protein
MRVTTKGQVTIPKQIRERLGIVPGSEVDFVLAKDGVRLVAVNEPSSKEESERRFRKVLGELAGTLDLDGMTADEYFEWIRGPREDLDLG